MSHPQHHVQYVQQSTSSPQIVRQPVVVAGGGVNAQLPPPSSQSQRMVLLPNGSSINASQAMQRWPTTSSASPSTAQPQFIRTLGTPQRVGNVLQSSDGSVVQVSGVQTLRYSQLPQGAVRYVSAVSQGQPQIQRQVNSLPTTSQPMAVRVVNAQPHQQIVYANTPTQGPRILTSSPIIRHVTTVAPGGGGGGRETSEENKSSVQKCAKFFRTLIQLAANNASGTRVMQLVKQIVNNEIGANMFTTELQRALNSVAQPHLEPFLTSTLPALRNAMLRREVVIEGINIQMPTTPQSFGTVRTLTVTQQPQGPQSSQLGGQRPPQQLGPRVTVSMAGQPQPQRWQQPQQNYQQMAGPSNTGGVQLPAQGGQGDDELNDVATICGVNINEESAQLATAGGNLIAQRTHILPPSLNDIESVGILNKHRLLSLMGAHCRRKMEKNVVKSGAVQAVARAVTHKMHDMLTRLVDIARHRSMKLHVFEGDTDVRSQVRFLNSVVVAEQQRTEERERSQLMKLVKSKRAGPAQPSGQGETEGDRLKQKARDLQSKEEEIARRNDANNAAMRALKSGAPSTSSTGSPYKRSESASSSIIAAAVVRRPVVVQTRDLCTYLPSDNVIGRMSFATRLLVTGSHRKRRSADGGGVFTAAAGAKRARY